jgi:glycoprotein-N-acetylgalactosamine 3-beta-galactosyltransferase
MAGGGHILSKKALTKFVTLLAFNETICQQADDEMDDVIVGQCLKKHAIFIDARDDKNQKQIFPIGVEDHMSVGNVDMSYWYWEYLWRNVTQGGLDCCSDIFIGSHYISPQEMSLMEYLIYNMHPFGLQKNLTETLARKLSLDEIVAASDAKNVFSPNYKEHEHIHYLDDDEKY